MKTFTNCAEKKAKQFLNLLQGYTKGIRMTAILVLLLMGVSNAWAANNEYGNNKIIYLNITNASTSNGWRKDQNSLSYKIKMYYNNSDNSSEVIGEYCCTRIGTSSVYYTTTNNDYVRHVQALRCKGNCGEQYNYSNRVSCSSRSYNHDNCIILPKDNSDWWDTWTPTWTCYVPGIASASINNTSTVYGGDGTEANPYQILVSSTLSVNASATSIVPEDNAPSKEYQFSLTTNSGTRTTKKNFSNSDSYSFTASATAGTKYAIDVEARNNNNSNIGEQTETSSTLYYVTISPVYAILGSFNNWTHSANTWDLSDQGSNTWKATFHLEQGNHTFKVVHNSSYYGKNSTTITRSSATASSLSTSGADINLTADYAGNYTFTFNSTTKNLTVTYPTIYKVTYSHVPAAAADAPTTNPSVTSGNNVVAGTSVTFTAKNAKTGYTWKGWYSNNAGSGTALSANQAYTTSITANTTIYAVYTPQTYTIGLNHNGGTGGSNSVEVKYMSNKLESSINNPTKTNYIFKGWYNSSSGNTLVIDINGNLMSNAVNGSIRFTDPDGNWIGANGTWLFAQWEPKTFKITYKDQGDKAFSGTHAANHPTTYTYGIETTLKPATKHGYTFDGWFTTQDCTGEAIDKLVAKAYKADITLYAKWTIKQYTLTFGAGEGGSVTAIVDGKEISSPATLEYNTKVVLTATPTGENAFARWVDGNGNEKTTVNPCTITITNTTIRKAEFNFPTTIYLEPSDEWKLYDARYAIYAWGGAIANPWVEMEEVGCEGKYFRANIPAGFTKFNIVRLKPGNGYDWNNDVWDQTSNLSVQANGKNLYRIDDRTLQYIHLKPNENWKSNGARFAAYFFSGSSNDVWVDMIENAQGVYTCKIPNGGHKKVIFGRMNPNADNGFDWNNNQIWNKTKDLDLLSEENCFALENEAWGNNELPADGEWFRLLDDSQWKTYSAPTYNVTIKPTIHGTYSVVCNGRTYLAPNKEEIVIPNVPVGTTLTIQDVKQNNETEYTSDIIYKESANAEYQTLEGNQITVCGNTTIDENFVTRNPHVVYFRVPTSLATSWEANETTNFVYSFNDIKKGETGYVTAMAEDNSIQDAQYTYYCCTIPADCHTFRFERKNNAKESAQQKTVSFTHAMPFNGMNCFTITNRGDEYTGYWDVLLTNGDYRLLYVEQVVEKSTNSGDEWKTVVTRKKAHPSDIIKKGTPSQIVSLHIYKERKYTANAGGGKTYESSNNPEIILQQYNSSTNTWENKERHMVFGPLQTLPGMAMAPGRRNVAANAELVYDDGIEIIKKDDHADAGSGVWNFTVTQSNGGEAATIDLTQTRRYNEETDGPYYIRTDVANGNWYNYTNPDNHMTRSDVSKQHSNYSHYFCKWVESTGNVNVKFTIANKYGYAISDTLEADRTDLWGVELTEAQKMLKNQTLPKDANVRFTWNEKSNLIHRAYIAGSANVQDRFLVLKGSGDNKLFNTEGNLLIEGLAQTSRYGLHANEEIFSDIENWVYKTDVQMIPGAELQVTADYNNQVQYFVGKEGEFSNTVLQGSSTDKYLIRLLYDFKTNELISAYVPGGEEENIQNISTNLMIIRQNYGEAKQLVFNNGDMSTRENRKAYGVIEFTEDYLRNEKIQYLKRCLYWVSFPFDVNLSEAFGSLVYGKHWLIQEYDGARRAAEGLWKESESFWTLHWEPNITLKAGLGYVIEIDINQMIKDNIIDTKDAKQQIAALYFPSNTPITREIIKQASYTVNIPAHKCEIVHTGEFGDRTIRDSHWNVIGVPSYINTGATFSNQRYPLNNVVKYYYQWDGEVDKYIAMEADDPAYDDFQSMYAYMVQYAGKITWKTVLLDEVEPAQIAAKKNSVTNEHAMRLELQQNNILLDKTFVRLQDDAATHAFDFNYDLCKITNKGANIYSIITAEASPVDVAANVLPIEETIIPIGIKTDAVGDYTFAMPDGTDGIIVELIDYETNTRTNMLLSDYTVSLPKGTNETRFALHVKPNKVVTGTENIHTSSDRQIKKYIIDGALYLIKDGTIYDAQGRCVK